MARVHQAAIVSRARERGQRLRIFDQRALDLQGSLSQPFANECARTYGFFVENSLITEKDYDDNPNDNLEKAARVITAIKGDLTHAVANEAADILRRRPKDAAKQLLALVEKVEGPKTVEGDKAIEWFTKIFASGHLELVIAAVGAEIAHLQNLDQAKRAFFAMDTAMG